MDHDFIDQVAAVAPLIAPNMKGIFAYAVLIGLGYGSVMSVDLELMICLRPPGGDAAGNYLGILTTAINVPPMPIRSVR